MIVVSLAVGLAVVAIGALHSQWGRNRVREAIERGIADKFTVPVKLGKARVTLGGRVVLEELSIGTALNVNRLEAEMDFVRALGGDVQVSALVVDGVDLNIDELLAALAPAQEPSEPLRLRIDRIVLTNATVTIGDIGIDIEQAKGSLALTDKLAVRIDEVAGGANARGLTASVTGSASLIDNLLIVSDTNVAMAESTAKVHLALADLAQLRVLTIVSAHVRAADVRHVRRALGKAEQSPDPLAPLVADLSAPVVIANLAESISVGLAGHVGKAGVAASAQSDRELSRLTASVSASALDPSAVWLGAPAGSLNVSASGQVVLAELDPAALAQFDIRSLRGELAVTSGGAVEPIGLSTFALTATAADGQATARLDVTTPRGHGNLAAFVRADERGELHVDSLEVAADSLDLSLSTEAAGGRLRRIAVRAHGPARDLSVEATADATSVRAGPARASRLKARATVRTDAIALATEQRVPTSGAFSASLSGVTAGGVQIRDVSAKGSFRDLGRLIDVSVNASGSRFADRASAVLSIEREPSATRIRVRRAEVAGSGETWKVAPADVLVRNDGTVRVSGLEVSSGIGRLTASGDTRDSVAIDLTDIDLARGAAFARSLASIDLPAVQGKLSGRAEIRDRGRIAKLSTTVRGFVIDDSPPVDAELDASVARGRLVADLRATQPDTGASATGHAELRVPRSVLDVDGWASLDLRALDSATLQVDQLSLALVERIAGRPIGARGTASVRLTLSAGAERLDISAAVRELAIADLARIDVTLDGSWDAAGVRASVGVDHQLKRAVAAQLAAPVPLRAALRKQPSEYLATPLTGTITLDRFALQRLNQMGLLREPVSGTLDAKLELAGTIGDPTATIKTGVIRRLEIASVTFGRVTLSGRADTRSAQAGVWAAQRHGGDLKVDAKVRWGDKPHADIEVTANRLDLRFLRAFADRPNHVLANAAGTVDAHVTLTGPPGAPVGHGKLKLRGGQLLLEGGARRLSNIELDATLAGERIEITRLSARSGQGSITARGRAQLVGYLPREFRLAVVAERFPVTAGDWAVKINARAALSGEFKKGRIQARAEISRGDVRLERSPSELQDTGDLEDVVYVDVPVKVETSGKTAGVPPIELKITVKQPIRVHGKEVELAVHTRLTLVIENGAVASLRGHVRAKREYVVVFDRRYRVILAEVLFHGNPRNPTIDVQLSRDFPSAEVRVHAYGSARNPKVSLTSDAGHDPTQVIAIMLGQDPDRGDNAELSTSAATASGSLLARSFAEGIPLVKFDVVKVHEDGFELGKWILEEVLAGYRFRSASDPERKKNAHELGLEWSIFRRLVLEARYGDRGIGNADLLYILRF